MELLFNAVQTIIIILASAIALYQLRISAKSNRSEAYSRIGDKLQNFNELTLKYANLHNILAFDVEEINRLKGLEGNEDLETKLHTLLDVQLVYYREIFNQRKRFGLITNSQWETWSEIIKRSFDRPYLRFYWNTIKWQYTKEFKEEIEVIINQ
ncbi:hypothetical protein [Seonamhaeicola sp.]|uniref:hypothetical protein n=1 Tax=Seonamhaeicola sp. TaxID=1912245 RepID=UPI00260328CC|nr:hypothetical protein [Seonamhaeicola sp.]